MEKFFITDTKKKKSLTATILFWGSIVCFAKLIFSGMTIGSVTIAVFSGSDFAMVMGSLGALYTARRSKIVKPEEDLEK